jgi:N utilization substance protein A
MSATPESKEEIRRLFLRHIPEVGSGVVEIVYVARDVGHRTYVAVHSHEAKVDPVGACAEAHGARLKAIAGELKGEPLTVVRWDEAPERFLDNVFGGYHPEIAIDQCARMATVTVDQPIHKAHDIRLITELTGWRIKLLLRMKC